MNQTAPSFPSTDESRMGPPARLGMVRPQIWYADGTAAAGLALYSGRKDYINLRPDRVGQNACRVFGVY